uniref:Integrase zinc-binding domain-containing protein n=1 Tax=Cyprinus carpio carpio TaxID=630221 RepID=A0A9J7XBJ0_CYPCA
LSCDQSSHYLLLISSYLFMQFRTLSIYFSADDNLFYSRKKGSDKDTKCKVVCSAEEADLLFKEFHSSNIHAHFGQLKTKDAISQRYYWPGITN